MKETFKLEFDKNKRILYVLTNKHFTKLNIFVKFLGTMQMASKFLDLDLEPNFYYSFNIQYPYNSYHIEVGCDLHIDIYDENFNPLYTKDIICSNQLLDLRNNYKPKERVYVTFATEPYLEMMQYLIRSLNAFSKYKLILYTINCDAPYEYQNVIKRRVDIEYDYHGIYLKPTILKKSIEDGIQEAIFIDGDNIVNKNIDELFDYFSTISETPLINRAAWEWCQFNGEPNPSPSLLELFNVRDKLNIPYGQTNIILYTKNCYDFFKEWESMCIDPRIHELYKTKPFIFEESIINVLTKKREANQLLITSSINVYSYSDFQFVLNFNYIDYNQNKELYSGQFDTYDYSYFPSDKETSTIFIRVPINKNEIKTFHNCKEPSELEKIFNYLVNN